ncbi:MAG TPA: hypothetical protein VGZ47_00330 [Gemmataceae bacterium]|nr:hypothetical protein [Gemmataceae bacterium]
MANDTPYKVIVEPWAQEFTVGSEADCFVVALHPEEAPSFAAEIAKGAMVLTVCEEGSTCEFWRGNVREFSTVVAIPSSFRSLNDASGTERSL